MSINNICFLKFRIGYFCATHPVIVLFSGVALCAVLTGGFYFFSVITDPVELWSPVNSFTRMNKIYFDTHFRPFYRTTQVIIRATNSTPYVRPGTNQTYSSIFQQEFLEQVFNLQLKLSSLVGTISSSNTTQNVTLKDICFKPLAPDNENCTIFSVFGYWQSNLDTFLEYESLIFDHLTHFDNCIVAPTTLKDTMDLSCLSDFGAPIQPYIALGGYKNKEYENATALVITFIINNNKNQTLNLKSLAWEKKLIEFIKSYSNSNMTISFNTERSLQDELDRETQSDLKTILISYIAMFLYIALTLGSYRLIKYNKSKHSIPKYILKLFESFLIDMKFILGIAGVLIVLLSVVSSIGLFSYFRVEATLIIFEVIPFLVLAVGIDNTFILVQTYQRDKRYKNESLESQMSRVVGKVGPSMFLTSSAESLAFLLGTLTPMPAVKIFSLYASLAVFIDFVLQITCFVSLMTLDCRRELENRYNLCCCLKGSQKIKDSSNKNGLLHKIFKSYYAPFLMNKWLRPIVILIFLGLFFTCIALLPRVNIGLDQKLSMPRDSYVLDYFESLEKYLRIGVPVYFVVKGIPDYSLVDYQNMICSSPGCNQDSLLNLINQASLIPNYTKIAVPANSWLDDYFSWLSSSDCCKVFSNDTNKFCPSTFNDFAGLCTPCPINYQSDYSNRPSQEDFYKYLRFFLIDNPGLKCSKGGHAAYGDAVELIRDQSNIENIGSTYFMTYHTVGVSSSDFIQSLKQAIDISDNITTIMRKNARLITNDSNIIDKISVFPYR